MKKEVEQPLQALMEWMNLSVNWKKISTSVVEMHNTLGGALINIEGENAAGDDSSLITTSTEEETFSLVGNQLKPKQVRRFMWNQRNSRALKRDNVIIWSWYDEEEDTTYMGFGAKVKPVLIERGLIKPERIVKHG